MFSSGVSQTGLCLLVPGSYSKTSTFENLGKIMLNMFPGSLISYIVIALQSSREYAVLPKLAGYGDLAF